MARGQRTPRCGGPRPSQRRSRPTSTPPTRARAGTPKASRATTARPQARTRPGRLALRADDPQRDSGHLTATFQNAGAKTVANLDQPSTTLHFEIVTGHDTLLDAETTDVDGGNLNLSHICACGEKSRAPGETRPRPSRPSAPVETQPAETQPSRLSPPRRDRRPSRAERDGHRPRRDREPAETATVPPRPQPVETATVPARDRHRSGREREPDGEPGHQPPVPQLRARTRARAARSTRRPARRTRASRLRPRTPSRTRPIPSNSGWQLVLVALASLIATALILTPATRRNRR